MIITISGKQGAGKTLIAEKLSKIFGYDHLSIGTLRGEMAQEKGMTIDEFNQIGEKEGWIHKKADEKTIEVGKTRDNFIMEGWIAHHFIPHAYKIFLDVDPEIGATRIFKDQRPDEAHCETLKQTKKMLEKRLEITRKQFRKYYDIDFIDSSDYDLVIDTSNLTPKQVTEKIIKNLPKPNKLKFYLCHPRESRFKVRAWQPGFEKKTGIILFNPFFDKDNEEAEKNNLGKEKYKELTDHKKLVEQDIQSIADPEIEGVIAYIDTANSWGSPMEIVYAKKVLGKKVYSIITNGDHHHPWLKYHSNQIFTSSEELEKFLIEKAKEKIKNN